jgi:hypothetical protein
MPKPLRAFEPRIEMPTSRGPLPCLIEMPGLSCSRSWTVKAGAFLMVSALIELTVCPGGTGSAPGAGLPSTNAAGVADVVATAGRGAATTRRGAIAAR